MRRLPIITALVILTILILSPASSTPTEDKAGAFTANPNDFLYRMTPNECFLLYYQLYDLDYELCPGDTVWGTVVTKAFVRAQMATFMNAALGQTTVIVNYDSGPTPGGADNYLEFVTERLF